MNKPTIYVKKELPKAQKIQRQDIIVKKLCYKETYNEKSEKIITPYYKEVNLTKKINETAKLIKSYTAQEKMKELERIATL